VRIFERREMGCRDGLLSGGRGESGMKLSGTDALKRALSVACDIESSIPAIAKKHSLSGYENQLEAAMDDAVGAYFSWWSADGDEVEGLGRTAAVEQLERALNKARVLLTDPKMRNRITRALRMSADDKEAAFRATFSREPSTPIKSALQAFAVVTELHKIAQEACKLDGRALNVPRRDDIRAAALPLRHFWCQVAGREEKLFQYDCQYQPNVEFLFDCLKLIDDTVEKRLLVELDK
jgi:hypothetical protein